MGTCERMRRVDAPADVVWGWLSSPHNLFSVNMLHAEVDTDATELRAGEVITIEHDFFGFYQQRRHAKIREVRPNFVAFGEFKAPEVPGRDPFPHNQSFEVVPAGDDSSILISRISGRYVFPGAGLVGERLFDRYMPALLDDDLQVVAVGCGAMPPGKVRRPPGLILWPLMAFGARFVKKSTRRRLLEQMTSGRAAQPVAAPSDATFRTPPGAEGASVEA
jgi:ligand-binding SRPBCC domain-containing protein